MTWRSQLGAVTAGLAASALAIGGLSTAAVAADDGPVEAGITVPKVEGMGDDWINGVDISSILSLEESGVTFYNEAGQEEDLFTVLADHGVNWVRVRVWNDPWTADGNGYGGGNVDADRATEIGKRATAAGMQVLVNFHYSDFWAHPGQQQLPKAWKDLDTVEQRAQAVEDYTRETLQTMKDAGVDVGMVQIGNENTPNSSEQIVEVGGWSDFATVVDAGASAVREVVPDAKVAVHFTNPERGNHPDFADQLAAQNVDYDVFLSSYYPFWHGDLDDLTASLNEIANEHHKDVAVAEVSWAYTLADGDGHENTIKTAYDQYSISVQGQALAIRDVMQAVADVDGGRGIGTFYWEPAWLPVGPPSALESNKELWEAHGSGWASSFAGEYEPDDAGVYYGGTSWDNQALFDFDGHPLESLNVYEYAVTGSVAPREVDGVASPSLTVTDGATISLPSSVEVRYTDGTSEQATVTWNARTEWIDGPGRYTITGTTAGGIDVTATVEVLDSNSTGDNLVVNPGFEDVAAGWTGTGTGFTIGREEDPRSGARATHWYSTNANSFEIAQTLTGVPAGTYRLSAFAQGDGASPDASVTVYAQHGISTVSASATLQGYEVWQNPTTDLLSVSAGGTVDIWIEWDMGPGAWGTLDDVTFALGSELPVAHTTELADLAAQARDIDTEGYTAVSVLALERALQRADFALGAGNPSQATVDGATAALQAAIDGLETGDATTPDPTVVPVSLDIVDGATVVLPETVTVTAFDDSTSTEAVTWNDSYEWISGPGVYTVTGLTENGWTATATITVRPALLLANGGFENGTQDASPWEITAGDEWPAAEVGTAWVSEYSEIEGSFALNGWSDDSEGPDFWLSAKQTTDELQAGTYRVSATVAGGNNVLGLDNSASSTTYELGVWDGAAYHSVDLGLLGWPDQDTQSVEFTLAQPAAVDISLSAEIVRGDWSYADNVVLERISDADPADTTALTAVLDEAAAVDRESYTTESVAALDLAVERAHVVLGADAPAQDAIARATAGVRSALDALVEREDPVEPTPEPTPEPSTDTTPEPTEEPTTGPTAEPTPVPTEEPTPEPTGTPTIEVGGGLTTVTAGDTITLRLTGLPDGQVEVGIASVYQRLAQVDVVDGSAIVTVTIPADLEPGRHHLQVRDASGAILAEYAITVEAPAQDAVASGDDATGEALPVTGADGGRLAGLLLVAIAFAAAGTALVVRRRS
ncbi:glycosyl hydrolase 53 family protein [Demequina globuliformis]|uniref:glycosyl hydrolase 53 family protein n=1 Tax=Demequina globuliformis TaxID=676202 RepID=UPI000782A4D8|nr:glycosyl hydrolase 53 family protein [Demequina globuliformis]